jgi:uncharacterized protein (DUF305 family)
MTCLCSYVLVELIVLPDSTGTTNKGVVVASPLVVGTNRVPLENSKITNNDTQTQLFQHSDRLFVSMLIEHMNSSSPVVLVGGE